MNKQPQQQANAKATRRSKASKAKQDSGPKPPSSRMSPKSNVQPRAFNPKSRQASAAAAYAMGQSSQAPVISASRDHCRVVHRELVTSISGASTAVFTVNSTLALNPGIASTFPWLSNIASNWDMYHFNRLKVCYYTRCGSSTTGSVILAPDYDASDVAPTSEAIVSTYQNAVEDAPWKDICSELRVQEMHPMGPKKFVRQAALTANEDIKTYDVGNLFICTIDSTAAAAWGKIWLEYDVTFYSPQINPQGSNGLFVNLSGLVPTSADILGTQTIQSSSPVQPATVGAGTSIITFATAGTFLVSLTQLAATSVTINANPVAGGGGTLIGVWHTATNFEAGSAGTHVVELVVIQAIVGSTITYNNTIVAGTSANVIVTQVPSNFA